MRVQLCSTSTIEGNKCGSFVIESAVIPQLNSGIMMVLFWFVHSLSLIIMFFSRGTLELVCDCLNGHKFVRACVCMCVWVNKAKVQIHCGGLLCSGFKFKINIISK